MSDSTDELDEILYDFLRNRNRYINANLARIDDVDLGREATKDATKIAKAALQSLIEDALKSGFYSGQAMARVELGDCHENWKKWNNPDRAQLSNSKDKSHDA